MSILDQILTYRQPICNILRLVRVNTSNVLLGLDGSPLSAALPVYANVASLPAASGFAAGSNVMLAAGAFVGTGATTTGIRLKADPVANVWVPDGEQVLFSSVFGNMSSGYKSINLNANTVKLDLGGADPVIPAGLLVPGKSMLAVTVYYRKIGAAQPAVNIYLGTDGTTYTNNSTIYIQPQAATVNIDTQPRAKIDFLSTTSAVSTGRSSEGGPGLAFAFTSAATLINTAADMTISFDASIGAGTEEIRFYKFRISIVES